MADVMQQLHQDHVNIARLLDVMDIHLKLFQEGEKPDYVLMMDVMQYMTHYPDLFHHPIENLVFTKLTERDSSSRLLVKELMNQHEALAGKGADFLDILRSVVEEQMVSRETLESKGIEYVHMLRRHADVEEGQAFPLAKKHLTEQDWSEIRETMEHMEDPLFGSTVEKQYLALYEYINEQVG